MTEKELYEFLIGKGFTETTIGPTDKRTFTGIDVMNNNVTVTFDKYQTNYEYVDVSMNNKNGQESLEMPITRLQKIKFQQSSNSTSADNSSHSTVNSGPPDPSSFKTTTDSQEVMRGLSSDTAINEKLTSNDTESKALNGGPPDPNSFKTTTDSQQAMGGLSSESIQEELLAQHSFDSLEDKEEASFDSISCEELGKTNIKIDLEDVKKLRDNVCYAAGYFKDDIINSIDDIISSLEELNPKTKEKLQSTIDLEYLTLSLSKKYRSSITEGFNNLISKLTQNIKDNGAIDDGSGSATPTGVNTQYTGGYGGGGGGHSGGSTDTPPIDDITPQPPTNQDNLNMLTPAIAGMVAFTEVVSMYTSIGAENSVQSSLTGNYGLLGLVHQNDRYYYKIIDKTTGQVYFVEMNDKAKITWDDKGERQAIEIVGDNAFVMKLPQEGEVLVRTAAVGDVYLLNGEKMTFDGIDYYNISDSVTGEVAYIPLGSGVSEPTLVSNLGSTTSSDSSSEVIQ